jgi:hypothetical protein
VGPQEQTRTAELAREELRFLPGLVVTSGKWKSGQRFVQISYSDRGRVLTRKLHAEFQVGIYRERLGRG